MLPLIIMGAGMAMNAIGTLNAANDEAAAGEANAAFYAEQAAFAQETGDRQLEIHDRESQILYGNQLSAFAKNGVDMAASSSFMSNVVLFRQKEGYAIRRETEMNVRLASLRADSAIRSAQATRAAGPMQAAGGIFTGIGNMISKAPPAAAKDSGGDSDSSSGSGERKTAWFYGSDPSRYSQPVRA